MFRIERRAAFVCFICGSLALVIESRANADARTSSLSWVRLAGADSCVSTQDLARDVEERLGRAVFVSAAQADVSVEGHIERNANGSGFHAAISIRDSAGKSLGNRELQRSEASCDSMRAPLALIVATMIDPDAALRKKSDTEAPPLLPPPAPPQVVVKTETVYVPVEAPAPPAPAPEPQRAAPPHRLSILEIDTTFTGSYGLLPSAAPGVTINLVNPFPFIRALEFRASYFFGSDVTASPTAHATFSLLELGTGVCPLATAGARVSVFACALVNVGSMYETPSGFGGVNAVSNSQTFVGAELDAHATIQIVGPLVGVLGIGGIVPFSRNDYVYDRGDGTQGKLFQEGPVGGEASLGVGLAY